jgi:hypothetical protein
MQKKKVAAALAAVQLYLQQESDEADAAIAALAASSVPANSSEPGPWAQSGRVEMMTGRRMIQLRAFAHAR